MYADGVDLVASIINTAKCSDSGQHWVAVVLSHTTRTVEVFDSTGEYKEELKPVLAFARYLADNCTKTMGTKYSIVHIDEELQQLDNTCGVYSLFYIYTRILGILPHVVVQSLRTQKKDEHILMFKRMLFGY